MEGYKENKKEKVKLKLHKESISFNNSEVVLMGGHHTERLFSENKDNFEKEIESADSIVAELETDKISNESSEMQKFYYHILKEAKENNKKVFFPDPEKKLSDAVKNNLPVFASVLAAPALATYTVKGVLDIIKNNEKLSRREFLKIGAAAIGTYAASEYALLNFLEQNGDGQDDIESADEDNFYSPIDWRDLNIAKKIINLSEDNEKILVVYGKGHFSGIKKYLKCPELIEKKMKIYSKTFQLLTNNNLE